MAYVDFTTFTEVDPNIVWSQTITRNTGTNVNLNDTGYIWKDYGVDYFTDDFEHLLDVRYTASGALTGLMGLYAVTNTKGDNSAMDSADDGLVLYFQTFNPSQYFLYLKDYGNDNNDSYAISLGTTYYLKITRITGTTTCKIYPTDVDRTADTNRLDTLSITSANTSYRYMQVGFGAGGGILYPVSGYCENLDITPSMPTTHSGTISANETWSPGDNPHIITGNITIDSGKVVTVEAGCEIYFDGLYNILSNGSFNVEGTEGNEVLITSNKTAPAPGDWGYLADVWSNSHLRHAIIEYGGGDDYSGGWICRFSEVSNCIIRYGGGSGGKIIPQAWSSHDYSIVNNIFHDNGGSYAIVISSSYAGAPNAGKTYDIKYNLFYDTNTLRYIIAYNDAIDGNVNIINNTFVKGTSSADKCIYFYNMGGGTDSVVVYNNIITGFSTGIERGFGSEAIWDVDYNDYYNCSTNTVAVGGDGTNSITSDPQFTDPGNDDYTILADSPCATSGAGFPYEGYIGYAEPPGQFQDSDTVVLSDQIELNLSLSKHEEQDILTLSDEINVAFLKKQELSDIIALSDDIETFLSKESLDTLTLGDTINIATIELSINNFYNKFNMVNGILKDINNDIRTLAIEKSDIVNDVRFLKSWQIPGDAGYQSLGKTYIKVYINSIEQTDVDIDSISISKVLNSSHTAVFILGRPYDNTKPSQESEVEIKYHIWTLYKGYITQINPGDRPDSIKIICQDEYWKQNKTKKYFFIGHRPQDNHELYYNYISQGLSACGVSFGIGEFVPQTMNCFGRGTSDCITNLVTNSGNFGWYYDVDNAKKLWTAGQGSIINLEKQEIGKNLGLYQILNHSFRESIENIVNKFRVQMGNMVIRRFNKTGGNKEYSSYRYEHFYGSGSPAWDSTYEILAKDSLDGHGVFHHPVSQNDLYKDVFAKYSLPSLSSDLESWSDRFPPIVQVLIPFGFWKCSLGAEGYLTEGFTIDYENGFLIFNEPIYLYQTNEVGEMTDIRAPEISLQLWKRKYYSNTEDPSDNPAIDISNPLMFFTDKMGDYPETIMENLELGGLGIQIGGWYVSGYTEEDRPIRTYVPSWNDTAFAKDYANWQLSKNCDKKIDGNIELTIDTICFYDIDLSKRIMIDEIIENSLNIKSITLNIGSWRASIGLQNNRYYKRNVSFQNHGV